MEMFVKMLVTKSSTYPKHHITWSNGTNYKNKDPFIRKSRIILWNKGQNSCLSTQRCKKKKNPDKVHILLSNIQESRNRNRLYLIKMIAKRKATATLYFIVKDWICFLLVFFFFFVDREQDKHLHSLFFSSFNIVLEILHREMRQENIWKDIQIR